MPIDLSTQSVVKSRAKVKNNQNKWVNCIYTVSHEIEGCQSEE